MVGEKILLPFNGKVAVNSIIVILILRFFSSSFRFIDKIICMYLQGTPRDNKDEDSVQGMYLFLLIINKCRNYLQLES
jgi:hypothetical protein